MFELSKILGPLLDPRTLLFTVLLVGTVLLWTPLHRGGRRLVTLSVVVALAFVFLPIGSALLHRIEHRFSRMPLPDRVDGIIALGGDFNVTLAAEYGPTSAASPRLLALADLSRRYPDARLVFTGGSGHLTPRTSEAELAPQIVTALGVDPTRVVFEGKSRNTRENATLTKTLMNPQPGEAWILVTSASHMPRSIGVFRAIGWPVIPYPVEFRAVSGGQIFSFEGGLQDTSVAAREAIGMVYYYARGWTDALFPAP